MRAACFWIAMRAGLSGPGAMAQDAEPPPSCIEATVNGERAPSYDCLTQKMRPPASAPRDAEGTPQLASEAIANRPSNQLGLFNRAATSTRMGNTFGPSVYPQRPPPVAPVSPLIPGR